MTHDSGEGMGGPGGRYLLALAQMVHEVVRAGAPGLTQQDSLIRPEGGGNSLNWVLGHLIVTYDFLLPRLGEQLVLPSGTLSRYSRGSAPLSDPAEAVSLAELLSTWDETARRVERGLGRLSAQQLSAAPGDLPKSDSATGLGDFITALLFHQAYHAGQLGLLRRIAGFDAVPA